MLKEKIIANIALIDAEAVEIMAKAHMLNGRKQALCEVLQELEQQEAATQ